jgi:hypothetical protein
MLHSVMNALFRCGHQRTTFPITPRRNWGSAVSDSRSGTYVACLDCGKEFAYDWKSMMDQIKAAARLPPKWRMARRLSTIEARRHDHVSNLRT